jgi:hypothetical protein
MPVSMRSHIPMVKVLMTIYQGEIHVGLQGISRALN